MREHQIVISLKPEHFQQVQRMARADGSKSVSVFVRQRLLSSLGLQGQEAAQEAPSDPDWQHIAGQLRRLHRELQVFIAESITNNQLLDEPEPPMFMVPEENFITKGAPILVEYNPAHQLYVEQRQALLQQQQSLPAQPAAPKAPSFDASADEMEQLADRAFAISPRLGAIESAPAPAPANRYDPLQDLLEDKLIRKAAQQEQGEEEPDEEPEEEEESAALPDESVMSQSTPQMAATAGATAPAEEQEQDIYVADDEEKGGTASSAAAEDDEAQDSTDVYEDDDDEAMQTETHIDDAQDENEDPDHMAPPPAPPPISGGPPPRKRAR